MQKHKKSPAAVRTNSTRPRRHPVLRAAGILFCTAWILCAVLPYLFCRVFNLASTAILLLFVPLLLMLIFSSRTCALIQKLRTRRVGRWGTNFLLTALVLIFGYAAGISGWMAAVCLRQPSAQSRAVCIVMGCQVNGEFDPSPLLANRLEAAEAYLNSHPEAVCIVSGCQGEDENWTEAAVMRNCLLRAGIDESRILLEEQAQNTEQNLLCSAALMRQLHLGDEVVIATDWWHQLRASLWAERCGLKASAAVSPFPRSNVCGLDPVYYARELLGMVRMLLLGY